MSFTKLALFSGPKERETAIRFLRFIGVTDKDGLHVSDRISEWHDLDELYASIEKARKSNLEATRLKALRRGMIKKERLAAQLSSQ